MREGLPWVTLKAAVTLDGKLAAADGSSRWITGEAARAYGHGLRNRHDAILVGAQTVLRDDPELTTRLSGGRDAVRIVLDSGLRLPLSRNVFTQKSKARTIVATAAPADSRKARQLIAKGVEVWTVAKRRRGLDLSQVLKHVTDAGMRSVLVEGGAQVHASFLQEKRADAICLFVAPKLLGANGQTWSGALPIANMESALQARLEQVERLDEDVLLQLRLENLMAR
jgi:diaminohydroxyphosphoribosylaminopyrimidine deaminase/5-amino-6-(5-phosphoribosylamino)uracil reductase